MVAQEYDALQTRHYYRCRSSLANGGPHGTFCSQVHDVVGRTTDEPTRRRACTGVVSDPHGDPDREQAQRGGMAFRDGRPFSRQQCGRDSHRFPHPLACPERPGFCLSGQRGDGRFSALAAAELLHVTVSTIADWWNAGILESVRAHAHGPHWMTLTPAIIEKLRKPTQRQ